MPAPPRAKSVTFCARCRLARPPKELSYHSDPGRDPNPKPKKKKPKRPHNDSTDSEIRYYSEPDAKYFEIDYQFLRELRKIAKNNCPKCRKKRSKKSSDASKTQSARYIRCNGRYHSDREHCRFCCRICNRSTDTLDSIEDDYTLVSKSYSLPSSKISKSVRKERKNSIQSNKSVSFLEESSNESVKDEPNYTATSFTNDLKKFLLKPSSPRLSLREKFIISFKQELEATKRSPKLKAIKGLWKSY